MNFCPGFMNVKISFCICSIEMADSLPFVCFRKKIKFQKRMAKTPTFLWKVEASVFESKSHCTSPMDTRCRYVAQGGFIPVQFARLSLTSKSVSGQCYLKTTCGSRTGSEREEKTIK